ncbi:MAG TPA: hypothetical protein VGM14_19910 [Streptosporangiaceae bacterium]
MPDAGIGGPELQRIRAQEDRPLPVVRVAFPARLAVYLAVKGSMSALVSGA